MGSVCCVVRSDRPVCNQTLLQPVGISCLVSAHVDIVRRSCKAVAHGERRRVIIRANVSFVLTHCCGRHKKLVAVLPAAPGWSGR
jgi:hypothetical protein